MKRALQFIGVLSFTMILASCGGANKLLEKGDYDGAIAKASKKYEKKGKQEHKDVLEQAYFEANEKALLAIEQNIRLDTEQSWSRVYKLANEVERRNTKFDYLLIRHPELQITRTEVALFKYYALSKANEHAMDKINDLIESENDWERVFDLVTGMETRNRTLQKAIKQFPGEAFITPPTEKLMTEARERATEIAFDDAMFELEAGRNGDFRAARRAYDRFDDSKKYGILKENVSSLTAESRELGISEVYIDVSERGRDDISYSMYQDLERVFTNGLRSSWVRFVNRRNSDTDFTIEIDIDQFDISRESERETQRTYNSTIRDFQRNSNGQFVLDTLGNRIPIDVNISGVVTTIERNKRASIDVEYRIIDERNNRSIERDSFEDDYRFRSVTYRRSGDDRAIPSEFKSNVPRLQRFPSDREMIDDLMNGIESDFRNELRRVNL